MNNVQAVKKPDTPYRKTYVLKQQTPMIHFQHGDSGVVIRASEFKPKLDKFLLKKLGKNLSEKKDWLLKQADGNQDIKAFNYKVRIFASGEPEKSQTIKRDLEKYNNKIELIKQNKSKKLNKEEKAELNKRNKDVDKRYAENGINGMYFGNMVSDNDKNYKEAVEMAYKETIIYSTDIYVEIQCFVKELLAFIDANMEEFLLVTNFGTRQSKGFGCFDLKKENDNDKTPIDILKENKYDFVYCEVTNPNKALKDVTLEVAAGIYAVMKGGINFRNTYVKGYIQRQYLNDIGKRNTGSDKAFIKAKILHGKFREKAKNFDNFQSYSDYEYVRAILGIPETIKFSDTIRNDTVKIEDKDELIKRFQSAIQIVVSGRYVILIMKDSYKAILGKKFIIYDEKKEKMKRNTPIIKVPSEFNPNQFLSGFVKYFNKEKRKLKNVNYKDAAFVELKMGREGKK